MKSMDSLLVYLEALMAAALLVACGKEQAPPALSADQVPAAVQGAFKDAAPEVKQSADDAVSAVQNQDNAKALLDLQMLSSRPDLTPEQRSAAGRSIISLNEKLRAAAAQGDQRAAEALEMYRAHK